MRVDKLFVKNITLTFLFMNFLFMILIVLGDLFVNLLSYLDNKLSISDIIYVYYLYLPKSFSDGVALSFLFSVSNLIGNLSMRNEIIGLFSCGISLARILRPIILISVGISVILFFFDNYLVIDTTTRRDAFLKNSMGKGSSDRTVIIRDFAREIYNIRYYDIDSDTISNLIIILKDINDVFSKRYDVGKATWVDNKWNLYDVREFTKVGRGIVENFYEILDGKGIVNLEPEYIKIVMLSSKTLNFSKLTSWIRSLKVENLDYSEALFDFLNRIFFSFRLILLSFTVGFISLALRKNIFILSLLNSIAFAVIYVISIVIFNFLADLGYLPITVASSFTTVLFLVINFVIYKLVRK
ncbi:LptF/LptG family permease [Borrelia sp. RT1S]|uniref:LptF/LptG family permease n=1 Tax=Borrelia sp. RT1S TaxID=2898580 RepID=UPI001E2DC2C3|nr:LptF/LptG family permease [Borrelia sp. RT1S]UGQ17582.1 LptF/LptG family permease [Borrelia sp. RT1S]